jgi:hypothetical protein
MEIDGEAFVDRRRINGWLATIPDLGADHGIDEIASRKSVDDEFDLDSVEMWGTRSAIAEGPWRRRIDKWNSIRLSAAFV